MTTTKCLRCGVLCRTGAPDPKARALVAATATGLCPNCMITRFLLSIEPIRDTIEGHAARGGIVPALEGKGPEIFLNAEWREKVLRPVLRGVLSMTQLPEDSINWIAVAGNWGLPFPRKHAPVEGGWW